MNHLFDDLDTEDYNQLINESIYKCKCGNKAHSKDWHHGYECCMQCFAEGRQ